MTGVAICTCGHTEVCPGDCAGARLQQLECAIRGHLTARSIHQQAWGVEPDRLVRGDYCFRCGQEGEWMGALGR